MPGTFVWDVRPKAVRLLLVGFAVFLAACGQGAQSHGGPVQDQVSLIDALRGKNLIVDISGTVSQPFLNPQSGTAVRLSGGSLTAPADLQLFEYASPTAASADARRISPDGSGTQTTRISWIDRKSTRLNSSHQIRSYAVFCLKKKMSCQPDILVLDEPTTALDVTTQIEVLAVIRKLIREHRTAGLSIPHQLDLVAQITQRLKA